MKKKLKLNYQGSRFWLMFWTVLFFPIALVLLVSNSRFEIDQKVYILQYDGSVFWLCFWTILLFPIAAILFFINGFSISVGEGVL